MDERQKHAQFSVLEQQMQEVMQQLEFFEEQQKELREAVRAVREVQNMKVGTTMYVQLAHGVRLKAKLEANDHVMVHVGADTTVHKTPQQAIALIEQQVSAVDSYAEKLTAKLQQLSTLADQIQRGNN